MSLPRDILFGVAVGDALGVPVEFMSRDDIARDPVIDMLEYGVHHQPKGTWSDDSSLTFCLAEVLTQEYNVEHIGKNFEAWLYDRYWAANGKVFDIGGTTRVAIERIAQGHPIEKAGPDDERSQGNGSLMRILPLVFHLHQMDKTSRWETVKQVSSITHGHINCAIACFIYLEIAHEMMLNNITSSPHSNLQHSFKTACTTVQDVISSELLKPFQRIMDGSILQEDLSSIRSGGYVIDTLEASLWCLHNTHSYESAVLKAVNLGDDTDTTAAVTGGIAGIMYGINENNGIPKKWLRSIVSRWDIEDLAERLSMKYPKWGS